MASPHDKSLWVISRLLGLAARLIGILHGQKQDQGNLKAYWSARARKFGKRSVLNLAHGDEQYDEQTRSQAGYLLPLFVKELNGNEHEVLDFGCGPGRFTERLAAAVSGKATGVDITQELIDLAPTSPSVNYQVMVPGTLPFEDASFDVVWACLVLGGIPEQEVERNLAEIERVLRPDGLFFFIENTEPAENTDYWFYRDEYSYKELARFCRPQVIGSYADVGQRISVFAGRKAQT